MTPTDVVEMQAAAKRLAEFGLVVEPALPKTDPLGLVQGMADIRAAVERLERTPAPSSWLTVAAAAERMNVDEKTVRREIDSGRLMAVKVRGAIRIDPELLDAYLAGRMVKAAVRLPERRKRFRYSVLSPKRS